LLSDEIKKIKIVKTAIKNAQNHIRINDKLTTILKKNSGFKIIRIISKILEGKENVKNVIPEDLNASEIHEIHLNACMKYAPINTADVE